MVDWTEKHRPQTLAAVRGNDTARDEFEEWARTWEDHHEAVILHGSPGVGKTSAAHALAADLGWDVIELNASDQRTGDVIERVAGEAAKSGTLTQQGTGGRRLVVLDEADNVHGNADRGGTRAITRLVKEADQPVVLIANEFYEMSRGLRSACEDIQFSDVSTRSIVPVLRDICRKEGVEFEEDALRAIADATSGDLRSAVNDLQAIAEETDRLTVDDVVTGSRDSTTGIFEFLDTLIKEADAQGALEASYDVDETPDDLINWIEDNLPKDYAGEELADAYGALADADRWLGRVRASQNYSYWRYAADDMTAGVAAARSGPKGGWTRYGPPSYWSKLGRTRGARETRDYVARRIAAAEGVSLAVARREVIPFLAAMTHHCKPRELTVAMAAAYELDADHLSFVTGSGADTNKVASIVEDAETRRESAAVEHAEGAFDGAERTEMTVAGDDADAEGSADEAGSETDHDGDDAQASLLDGTEAGSETGRAAEDVDETENGEKTGGPERTADGEATGDDPEREDDDSQAGLSDFV